MNGVEVTVSDTAAHTADTPQLLLEHHLKEPRLPTILREYDKVARQCAVEQVDYQRYLLRMTELELLDRERRATERCIRQAKFPSSRPWTLRLRGDPVTEQDPDTGTGTM